MDDYHTKCELPLPVLDVAYSGSHRVRILTDEHLYAALGLRIAFTSREGGVSKGAFASLNLASHVNDNARDVQENRRRIAHVMGCTPEHVCVPNQIHSTRIMCVSSRSADDFARLSANLEKSSAFAQYSALKNSTAYKTSALRANTVDCDTQIHSHGEQPFFDLLLFQLIDEAFRSIFLHNTNIQDRFDRSFLSSDITQAFDVITSAKQAQSMASHGFDAIVVDRADTCPLLCFADCLPVIIASPTGRFAVVHAGWRGAYGQIASRAACALACLDALECIEHDTQKRFSNTCETLGDTQFNTLFDTPAYSQIMKGFLTTYNIYIGPHISQEAFEVGDDVASHFVAKFGAHCSNVANHVSLARVVEDDVCGVGCCAQRIANAHQCTFMQSDLYFSYRHAHGVCGRIGALAYQTHAHGNSNVEQC